MTNDPQISFDENSGTKSILIVEDDNKDTILIVRQVRELFPDAKIIPTKSLSEAYQTYRQQTINLVLLDLNLPDGYGPTTVSEMRRFNVRTPIIVLTTLGNDITVKEAMKNGANRFFLKTNILTEDFKSTLTDFL